MNSAHAAKVALFKSALEKVDPASYHAACMSVFHRFYDTCSIAQILNMMNVAIESLLPHSGVPILLLRFGTALYMRNNFPVLNMGYYFGFGKEVAEAVRDTGFGQGMQMFGCHFQMTEVLMAVEGRFVLYYGSSNSSRLFAFVASLVDQWVLKTLLLQHKVNNYSAIASAFRSNLEIHSQTIFDEQFRKANLILVKNPPADNDLSAASTAATHLPPDSYTGSSGQQHPPKRVRFEAATVDQPPRRSPPPSSDPAVNVYPRSSTTPPRTSPPPSSEPTVDQPPRSSTPPPRMSPVAQSIQVQQPLPIQQPSSEPTVDQPPCSSSPPPRTSPVAQSLPVHQSPSAPTVDQSLPVDAINFSQVDNIPHGASIVLPGTTNQSVAPTAGKRVIKFRAQDHGTLFFTELKQGDWVIIKRIPCKVAGFTMMGFQAAIVVMCRTEVMISGKQEVQLIMHVLEKGHYKTVSSKDQLRDWPDFENEAPLTHLRVIENGRVNVVAGFTEWQAVG